LDYAVLFGVAGVLVALDQWTKHLVRTGLAFEQTWSPWEWLEPYARVIHWRNSGAAFGILQQFGGVFTILAILVSLAILYYYPQVPRQAWYLRMAMGIQLGGALGNLIDRLTQGYVTDFISVGSFAVFNVADACISVGVVILVLGMWNQDKRSAPPPETPGVASPPPAAEEAHGE
jgi:signal peptidase II